MSNSAPALHRAHWPLIAGALLLLALFYSLTLRTGHPWGGDNAMYVSHAQNLITGAPYAETGYLYNPGSGRLPVSYPPVFPLILAPLVSVFGVAWGPLKLLTISCLIAGLALLAAHERTRLGSAASLAAILLVGLNPLLWDFKDQVLSEYPFLMFVCATLYLADRHPERRSARYGLLLGVILYLAYGTRSVGALLLPALLATPVLRGHRPEASLWGATLVFAGLALLQNVALHSEASHLAYKLTHLRIDLPFENAFLHYPRLFHRFWASDPPLSGVGVMLAVAAAALGGFGLFQRLRARELDTLDNFVLASLGFFLLIRLDDMTPPERYWIPLFPLFVVQVLRGVVALPVRSHAALLLVLLTASALAYASTYRALDRGTIPDGITSRDALALYEFIRSETEPQDPLLFFEPRVLTLYTGRQASELPLRGGRSEWMAYAETIQARYWIRPGGLPPSYQDALTLVFANDTFSVFRFERYR